MSKSIGFFDILDTKIILRNVNKMVYGIYMCVYVCVCVCVF